MSQIIKYVHIKNFKGIKDVEINNLSRFVAIFGANGAGKTSFLEAIQNAIKLEQGGNKKVRIGESQGLIDVHFEDFKVTRIIGEKGKLSVEHNGELVERPQEWLNNIFLGVIGDPQKFISLHNKEKVKYIVDAFGKKEEYEKLESQRLILYNDRADVHRTVLNKKEEIDSNILPEEIEIEEGDINELNNELKSIQEYNNGLNILKERKKNGEQIVENLKQKISTNTNDRIKNDSYIGELLEKLEIAKGLKNDLEEKGRELSNELEKSDSLLNGIINEIIDFKEKDSSKIEEKISKIISQQRLIGEIETKKKIHQENIKKYDMYKDEWRELDNNVKIIEEEQNNLIKGLNISYEIKLEDGVMYVLINESWIPLDELNTATQLDLGVDILLNGPNKIKIITIENANSLDPNTMEKIKAKIEKMKAQCFLETVYKTGYESITIQDGESI